MAIPTSYRLSEERLRLSGNEVTNLYPYCKFFGGVLWYFPIDGLKSESESVKKEAVPDNALDPPKKRQGKSPINNSTPTSATKEKSGKGGRKWKGPHSRERFLDSG